MREIILDTETTGLDPLQGHRLVEIGAVELWNHMPTGKTYHVYLNPERDMPREAQAVHGLTSEFLKDKALFTSILNEFLAFIADSPLIIHNATFDMNFINAELSRAKHPPIPMAQVIDTLAMARKRFPAGPNSLDALCKRFGIDLGKRTKHGALVDSELLAAVYLELKGGRQTTLTLAKNDTAVTKLTPLVHTSTATQRPSPLPQRLTEAEKEKHMQLIEKLGASSLWRK